MYIYIYIYIYACTRRDNARTIHFYSPRFDPEPSRRWLMVECFDNPLARIPPHTTRTHVYARVLIEGRLDLRVARSVGGKDRFKTEKTGREKHFPRAERVTLLCYNNAVLVEVKRPCLYVFLEFCSYTWQFDLDGIAKTRHLSDHAAVIVCRAIRCITFYFQFRSTQHDDFFSRFFFWTD